MYRVKLSIFCILFYIFYASFLIGLNINVVGHQAFPRHSMEDTNFDQLYRKPEDFEGFDNDLGLPTGMNIVPNIVHFIVWKPEISFMEAICILAAVFNQKPDNIYIHSHRKSPISGRYWLLLANVPEFTEIAVYRELKVPEEIFGQKLNSTWKFYHGSDVARLQILQKHGGIFLETDTFLVNSLDEFRKFEMALGWQSGDWLANQAIVAHKNARFLHQWLDSYNGNYRSEDWNYNSRERPTTDILAKRPGLIRRMTSLFCETYIQEFLYLEDNSSWNDHYVIHMGLRKWAVPPEPEDTEWVGLDRNLSNTATYPVVFNEFNILDYNCTIRQMVQSVMGHLFRKSDFYT